jgi:hypothetical protein
MKIARWHTADGVGEGFVIDDRVVPFSGGLTVADVLTAGLDAAHDLFSAADAAKGRPISEVTLLAPLVPAAIRDFVAFEEPHRTVNTLPCDRGRGSGANTLASVEHTDVIGLCYFLGACVNRGCLVGSVVFHDHRLNTVIGRIVSTVDRIADHDRTQYRGSYAPE